MQASANNTMQKWAENKKAVAVLSAAQHAVEQVMEALGRAGRTGPRAEELANRMADLPVEMWGMLGFTFNKDGTLVAPQSVVKTRRASLEVCMETGETTTHLEAAE